MKNLLKITSLFSLLGFAMLGCEKEEEILTVEKKTTIKEDPVFSKTYDNQFIWATEDCLVPLPEGEQGPLNLGKKCVVSAIDGCPAAKPCEDAPLAHMYEFTQAELDAWQEGTLDFDYSDADFINEHYEFFLYLYSIGEGHHPDTIIARNGL